MELTGRLTADAQINKLTDEREVTNFTLVMNDHFTTKAGEKREVATFVKCAYWVSPKVAQHLKKGCIISVYGRIGLDVYSGTDGKPQGSLTFHVNNITFIAPAPKPKPDAVAAIVTERAHTPVPETIDDLPF